MVVEINRRCELVYDLNDVSNIIRKYYNADLADEMDRLLKSNESCIKELECEVDRLRNMW